MVSQELPNLAWPYLSRTTGQWGVSNRCTIVPPPHWNVTSCSLAPPTLNRNCCSKTGSLSYEKGAKQWIPGSLSTVDTRLPFYERKEPGIHCFAPFSRKNGAWYPLFCSFLSLKEIFLTRERSKTVDTRLSFLREEGVKQWISGSQRKVDTRLSFLREKGAKQWIPGSLSMGERSKTVDTRLPFLQEKGAKQRIPGSLSYERKEQYSGYQALFLTRQRIPGSISYERKEEKNSGYQAPFLTRERSGYLSFLREKGYQALFLMRERKKNSGYQAPFLREKGYQSLFLTSLGTRLCSWDSDLPRSPSFSPTAHTPGWSFPRWPSCTCQGWTRWWLQQVLLIPRWNHHCHQATHCTSKGYTTSNCTKHLCI